MCHDFCEARACSGPCRLAEHAPRCSWTLRAFSESSAPKVMPSAQRTRSTPSSSSFYFIRRGVSLGSKFLFGVLVFNCLFPFIEKTIHPPLSHLCFFHWVISRPLSEVTSPCVHGCLLSGLLRSISLYVQASLRHSPPWWWWSECPPLDKTPLSGASASLWSLFLLQVLFLWFSPGDLRTADYGSSNLVENRRDRVKSRPLLSYALCSKRGSKKSRCFCEVSADPNPQGRRSSPRRRLGSARASPSSARPTLGPPTRNTFSSHLRGSLRLLWSANVPAEAPPPPWAHLLGLICSWCWVCSRRCVSRILSVETWRWQLLGRAASEAFPCSTCVTGKGHW